MRICGNNSVRHQRSGFTFIGFAGYLAALGGGLVGGLMYFDCDFEVLADEALVYVDTCKLSAILTGPTDTPEQGQSESDVDVQSAGTSASALAEQLGTDATGAAGDVNQNYWLALTSSLNNERAQRTAFSKKLRGRMLFDYLSQRKRGHEDVVAAMKNTEARDVDRNLRAHARQIISWHQNGEELHSRALDLLADSSSGKLTGPLAKSWHSAANQHQMEERLLRGKHFSVAGYLNSTYEADTPFYPAVL